jgi:hypothetical protein
VPPVTMATFPERFIMSKYLTDYFPVMQFNY